jgi:glutamyl-tRNA synthetase
VSAAPPADAPIVGRLAPSPTGHLHLGHARTFLLAWWHLRARGGRVLLRIEDLDRARVRPELIDECRRDLEWLGLDWDGEALLQSQDTGPMEAALERLLADGRAYACTCSRREIEAARSAPHADQGELRYPGTCRGRWPSPEAAERATGAPAGLRLAVAPGAVTLQDGLVGSFTHDVAAEVGDFLLARRDGVHAYQLAVVVDDARTGVTEVLRGDDLLPSATRQWHLLRALGLTPPRWFHVPLVVDESGRRLAKRDADLALAALRERGVDPRAVVEWVARGIGMAPGRTSASERCGEFDLARVGRAPAVLTGTALAALQATRA